MVLSPHAVRSKWVKREVVYALIDIDKRYEDRIVPVLSQPCDHQKLSWTLQSFQMVNFCGDFGAGCRELLKLWGQGYKGQ